MKKKLVQVLWEDCEMVAENWTHPEDMELPEPGSHIQSYGILWQEDDHAVVIAADYDSYRGNIGRATWIPKSQIKSMKTLGKLDV